MKNHFLHGLAKLCLIAYVFLANSYTAHGQNHHLTQYDSLMPYTTSGRLLERSTLALSSGGAWYNPQLQSGRYDTICRPSTFGHLLQMMYEAGYGYSTPPIASDSLYSIYRQTAFVPPTTPNGLPTRNAQLVLGVLDMDYDHLTPYAYDSSCLRIDSASGGYLVSSGWVHLYDTVFLDTLTWSTHPDSIIIIDTSYYHNAGPCLQNSFDRNWLFALTAFDDFIYLPGSFTPTITVSVPQALFMRSGATEAIEIDWGNGMGWQSLSAGTYTVSYPGFGEKIIRIRRADGRYDDPITAFARVTLVELPFGAPDFIIPFGDGPLPCGISDQGLGIGSGWASVWRANGSNHLRKPFVIVEGFDRDDKKQPLNHPENDRADEWGFGLFTAASFSSGQMGERGEQLALAPNFIDSLLTAGYDVVFVDFMTNGARIEKNGFALIDLIQRMNQNLAQGGYNSSIDMMGVSMG